MYENVLISRITPGERHVVDRLHRRHGRHGHTIGQEQRGQLDRPEVQPDEDHRSLAVERLRDHFRCLDDQPPADELARDRRRPRHLEVVARLVTEGGTDQALEHRRIARGPAGDLRSGLLVCEPLDDTPQVAPALRGAIPVGPIPGVAGHVGKRDEGPIRKPTGEPRDDRKDPDQEALLQPDRAPSLSSPRPRPREP